MDDDTPFERLRLPHRNDRAGKPSTNESRTISHGHRQLAPRERHAGVITLLSREFDF